MSSSFSTAEGTRPDAFGPAEWLLMSVPALIWGTSFLLISIALDDLAPGTITFGRIAAGALSLAALSTSRSRIARRDWPRIWLLALFWMAIPFTLFPIAQQWVDSSLAGMLNGTTPLFTALVAALLLRRPPGRSQVFGLVVGFAGVVGILWPALDGDASLAGCALVLLAAASYGVALNLVVPLQQRYPGTAVFLRTQVCALVLTLPLLPIAIPDSDFTVPAVSAVVALGVGATSIAFVAIGVLSARAGATRASVTVYLVPIVAVVVGVAFNDEAVSAVSLVGIVVTLTGAGLTSRAEPSRRRTRETDVLS